MKCMMVLNGFSDSRKKRLGELLSLWKGLLGDILPETMIFLGHEDFSAEEIQKLPAACVKAVLSDAYDIEQFLPVLEELLQTADVVLFDSGYAGIELAGRLAARTGGTAVTKVGKASYRDGKIMVQKNIYSNHMNGEFVTDGMPCFLSAEPGIAPSAMPEWMKAAVVEQIKVKSGIREYSLEKEADSDGLEEAKFLVAAGRGAGSKAGIEEMEKLAEHMGAKFGISRPVAMSAWASMDKLIGVSGAITGAKICIAAGVSGAPAFYAGIEKSDFIVAVNTDGSAELLKKADAAIEGDGMEFLQELDRILTDSR